MEPAPLAAGDATGMEGASEVMAAVKAVNAQLNAILPWLFLGCHFAVGSVHFAVASVFCDHASKFLLSTAVESETYAELDCLLELQGPTSGVYQEADRLQQLQQQQQQLHQQQQQQQQRSVDNETLQLNAFASASVSAAEADVNQGFPQASQNLAGKHSDRQDQQHTDMCPCVSWVPASSRIKDVCTQHQELLVLFQPCAAPDWPCKCH